MEQLHEQRPELMDATREPDLATEGSNRRIQAAVTQHSFYCLEL
jgi:hypothetical protein